MEFLENLNKTNKKAQRKKAKPAKKAQRKAKKTINKAKAKEFIKKQGFKLLFPFKPMVLTVLNDKGIQHDGSTADMMTKFYELITGKKVDKVQNLNGIEYIIDDVIDGIVSAILAFFKNTSDKKKALVKAGEPVPPAIEKSAKVYDTAYNDIKDAATEEGKIEAFPYLAVGAGALIFFSVITNKK